MPVVSGSALFYALLTLCLLLALGTTWQAWRAPLPLGRRLLRLLAGLLAAAGLWLSTYPPTHPAPSATATAALLLTPGYQPDSVQALRRQLGPARIFRYRPAALPTADTLSLTALSVLPRLGITRLHVLGEGLPAADAATLPATVRLIPHPSQTGLRLAAPVWNERLVLGEWLRLSGYCGGAAGPVWLRLRVAGAVRDSARLPANGGSFVLRYQPRTLGPLVAHLEAWQGTSRLLAEPVPAIVARPRPLRLLLLGGSPSFELNLLKNRLAERGHQVALRLGLGRGLTQTDAQNRPALAATSLTPATLRGVDVLVADADALTGLTPSEAAALRTAATEGLGVLLTGATALPRTLPAREAFTLLPNPTPTRPQLLRWPDQTATAPVPATLRLPAESQALIQTANAPVAATHRLGWGTVLVATPASTFPWLLSGQEALYDAYWRTLLTAAARPLEISTRWLLPRWPRVNEPQPLRLQTSRAPRLPGRIFSPTTTVTTLPWLPEAADTWQLTYRPTHSGWHQLLAPGLDTTTFYAYAPTDWPAPLQAERLAAVPPVAVAASLAAVPPAPPVPWLPAGWYFALFVLAAGWLWLDEKR